MVVAQSADIDARLLQADGVPRWGAEGVELGRLRAAFGTEAD